MTFTSANPSYNQSSLIYSVAHLPQWATFDPSNRMVFGTPGPLDATSTNVQVSASDIGSSQSTSSFQLIVSDSSPPKTTYPLAAQFSENNRHLSSVTVLAADQGGPGVQIKPGWSFSIGLAWDTYTFTNGDAVYYTSTLESGDPLPDWLVFDPVEISFSGVTPTSSAGQTPLAVTLHAAEKAGFSAVHDTFSVYVLPITTSLGSHTLHVMQPLVPINITVGEYFSIDLDQLNLYGLEIDDGTIDQNDIKTVTAQTADISWVSYNMSSAQLEGSPPIDLLQRPPTILPLDLTIGEGNLTIATNISLVAYSSAFSTAVIPSLSYPPTSRLVFDLNEYMSNATDLTRAGGLVAITATFNPQQASDWLNFSLASKLLTGDVPLALNCTTVIVNFHAISSALGSKSSTSLILNVSPSPEKAASSGISKPSRRTRVAVAVTVSAVSVSLLLCFILAACKWRRRLEPSESFPIRHQESPLRTFEVSSTMIRRSSVMSTKDTDAGMGSKGEIELPANYDGMARRDAFETAMRGSATEASLPTTRPPSVRLVASISGGSLSPKIANGAFFQNLRGLSKRPVSEYAKTPALPVQLGSGKENKIFSTAPLAYHKSFHRPCAPSFNRPRVFLSESMG